MNTKSPPLHNSRSMPTPTPHTPAFRSEVRGTASGAAPRASESTPGGLKNQGLIRGRRRLTLGFCAGRRKICSCFTPRIRAFQEKFWWQPAIRTPLAAREGGFLASVFMFAKPPKILTPSAILERRHHTKLVPISPWNLTRIFGSHSQIFSTASKRSLLT